VIRLFIALPLEKPAEEMLGRVVGDLRTCGGRVSWVRAENIHLTVKFLGDTEEDNVSRIAERLDEVSKDHRPVSVTIDRLGGFPNLSRPRVIWAGIEGDIEVLDLIAAEVDRRMQSLGWDLEKRGFKPHLTLGRVRDTHGLERLTDRIRDYKLDATVVLLDRLTLFKSTLTPQGAIYERLHESMLGSEGRFSG